MQSSCLAVHVFYHDIIDLPEGSAVFQHLPGLVGMKMDLDQFLITHGQQTIAVKVVSKILTDLILVQILAFEQQLRILSVFKHFYPPFAGTTGLTVLIVQPPSLQDSRP